MSTLAIGILAAAGLLVLYLFAKADGDYVFIRDRPKPWTPKRKSINYYAWQGPFFIEDFSGGTGGTGGTGATVRENFGNFQGANNPKDEIVPTCGACEIPKYNATVKGAKECHKFAMNQCRVRTQTSEKGYKHEFWNSAHKMEGPHDGLSKKMGGAGNFQQSTNNNLSAPNNLPSAQMRSVMGDWFDDQEKVSPWCYAETYNQCMANPKWRKEN